MADKLSTTQYEVEAIIAKLLEVTEEVANYKKSSIEADKNSNDTLDRSEDPVTEEFLALLNRRDELFLLMRSMLESNPEGIKLPSIQNKLRELYEVQKAAEDKIEKYKLLLSKELSKIEKGKRSSELYEKNKNSGTKRRVSYQATPDAAFFDQKK